ncbi:MAG: hypothetical protein CO113_06555 [Elusimicrobia bacterium CG_4_9_14_3_um_filter_62_55]|nr:MAG: hypothetical protein COR54_14260 [Elusimicrobia bacterium CG22_combo_CG10-13_8_21_14_all_63_91]PJB25864.1 MAG: hypothetical protein CO113_06555 [Elusimicrobia bacterium CG_4_9_14_3_um_filter_62_55]
MFGDGRQGHKFLPVRVSEGRRMVRPSHFAFLASPNQVPKTRYKESGRPPVLAGISEPCYTGGAHEVSLMSYRILIVDDSPVLRVMLSDMLQELGHQVVAEADSGAAALSAYPEHKPDLVCLDVSLPDISGLEVLPKLRRLDPRAKVLIVTGNDQKTLEAKVKSLGAIGVLHKPFDSLELGAMLAKVAPKAP